MNAEKISYAGKEVFIGIDAHKRTYSVSCVCEGELVKRSTMEARPSSLYEFIVKYFSGAVVQTAYEASFCGFTLHRFLVGNGISNLVVHAAAIEVAARDKVKTDKRDSLKIATQLAAKRLRGIAVPSETQESRRLITRTREQVLRQRARLMNQLRSKLHQFGLLAPEDRGVLSYLKLARALTRGAIPSELKIATDCLVRLWRSTNEEIKALNRELAAQASKDCFESVYRSMPRFGPVRARILANELGDMSQFPNERALFSFTGLTPGEYSTGEHRRLGHISRQGSSRVRGVLIEAAWDAITVDPALRNDFERVAQRTGKKRAIVAIARRLIGHARALFRKKQWYAYTIGWKKAA